MLTCTRPVCVTRTAPFTIDSNQLVYYDVVDSSITSRCNVLSSIAQSGGDTKLPASVTLPSFKAYMSAAQGTDAIFKSMSLSSMCTVIEVRSECKLATYLEN